MKRFILVAAAFATFLASGGCRLYFWAGEHELTVPPEPAPMPTPSP